MKLNFAGKISRLSKILLIVAAIFTAVSAFTPVWRIDLAAPQYPEGMSLFIGGYEGLSGGDGGNDLYKINELNHYVGMAQMHPGDFWEFTVLPYLLLAFAVLFAVAAFMKSKKLTFASLVSFGIFGVLGFVDFYHWTSVYGHNLSPDAPIKVPGMAYQPPVIGEKTLLNFDALSQPHYGGYLLILAGLILAFVVFKEIGVFDLFKKKPTTC